MIAHSSADGICANYLINLLLCQAMFPDSLLDHDPTHDDIRAFLGRLKMALAARNLTLCGVTTDGSALYPVPLLEVFGDVPHQLCTFHVLAEVGQAVLGAVASARKGLAATQPKLRRGRPSTPAAKQAARTKKRLAAQGAALFTHRSLFVQRHLNTTERRSEEHTSELSHLGISYAVFC